MTASTETSSTADSGKGLGSAFRSAMFWNITNMTFNQVMTTVVFLFLTYKLSPEVFGLFALGVLFVDYFHYQARSSGVDALIQGQDFSKPTLDTSFNAGFLVILGVSIVLMLGAGLMAWALKEPQLAFILPALALTLLPMPFIVPAHAVLANEMDFRGIAMRGIAASIGGGAAAVIVAIGPYAEWALVVQRAVNVIVSAIFLMLRTKWFPSLHMNREKAGAFLRNSGSIFLAQAMGTSLMRILNLIVGVSFGAAAIGLMSVAAKFLDTIYGAIAAPMGSLWVIMLSKERESKSARSSLYLGLTQMAALICLPVFAGIALTSYDIVHLVLNDEFAGVAPFLAIFAGVGVLSPLFYFRNFALTALKRANLLRQLALLDFLVLLGAALLAVQVGELAVAGALIVPALVSVIFVTPILLREMNTEFRQLVEAVLPPYIAITLMAAGVLGLSMFMGGFSPLASLIAKAGAGVVIYAAYLMLFHRKWVMTAIDIARQKDAEPEVRPA